MSSSRHMNAILLNFSSRTSNAYGKSSMPSPGSGMSKSTAGCLMCRVSLSPLILNTFSLKCTTESRQTDTSCYLSTVLKMQTLWSIFWSFSVQVRYRYQNFRDCAAMFLTSLYHLNTRPQWAVSFSAFCPKLSQRYRHVFFLAVIVVIYLSKFCSEISSARPYVSSLSILWSHSLADVCLQLPFWNLQRYRKWTIDCLIFFFVTVQNLLMQRPMCQACLSSIHGYRSQVIYMYIPNIWPHYLQNPKRNQLESYISSF